MHSDYEGQIELLYSARKGFSGTMSSILFMKQIRKLFEMGLPQRRHHYTIFCTNRSTLPSGSHTGKQAIEVIRERRNDTDYVGQHHSVEYHRFEGEDLMTALGPVSEREKTVAYVCGPPAMTDWAVGVLRRSIGMEEKRVLCEKWW